MAEQSHYRSQTTDQNAQLRIPYRPNFADPCELLPLFGGQQEDRLPSEDSTNNSDIMASSNRYTNINSNPGQRPFNEVEGTLLPANTGRTNSVAASTAIPIAVAVAVPFPVYTGTASLPPPAHGGLQQQNYQFPSAPLLPATAYGSSNTGSKFDEITAHAIPNEALLPDKTFHADAVVGLAARPTVESDENMILNANAIAQLRNEEDSRLIRKGENGFRAMAAAGGNIVCTANAVAFMRDAEGLEVDGFTHDYAMAANLSRDAALRQENIKKSGEDENKNLYKSSSDGEDGYKINDYEVSEYKGYEYKSDYEYKSVYD